MPQEISKITDLTYLINRTKANPELMKEMIGLYLKQTPPLVSKMKQGLLDKDWNSVYEAAHKLIPSFSIMGINRDFETAAKKIQEYSGTQKHLEEIHDLVLLLENVCAKACEELIEELKMIKNAK